MFFIQACFLAYLQVTNPTLPFRPAKQVTASSISRIQTQLRFVPTSSASPDADFGGSGRHSAPGAGAPTPDLGPHRPEVTSMEGSAAPNPNDHRADADEPASDNQSHDASRMGVETEIEATAEQPHVQPVTQDAAAPSPPRTDPILETAAPTRSTPATPTRATSPSAAPSTPVSGSLAASNLQRTSPAKAADPAQGTSSSAQRSLLQLRD